MKRGSGKSWSNFFLPASHLPRPNWMQVPSASSIQIHNTSRGVSQVGPVSRSTIRDTQPSALIRRVLITLFVHEFFHEFFSKESVCFVFRLFFRSIQVTESGSVQILAASQLYIIGYPLQARLTRKAGCISQPPSPGMTTSF